MSTRAADNAAGRATPGDVLRSLAFYLVFYAFTAGLVLVVTAQLALGGRGFVRTIFAWSRVHRRCVERILRIRIAIEGSPPQGPALVALKHESFYEAIDLPMLLPYPAVFAKVELMRLPLWGRAGKHYGLIGVERGEGAKALRAMVAAARTPAIAGRPLAIFPEGTRVPHGERPPLQSGFAGLYKLLGLPVVAAAVDSGPLYHRTWKRRGTITIRFAPEIAPGLPREEVEAQVHARINALNPQLPA